MEMNPPTFQGAKAIGIDIGAGSIKAGLVEKTGKILYESSRPTHLEITNSEFLFQIQDCIREILESEASLSNPSHLLGIGIGSPGQINSRNGILISSPNLIRLKNLCLVQELETEFSIPAFMNNDANCASLGEYVFGEGKGSENLFVFTLGTGLGGGWVWKGELFEGFSGNGMEVGHTTVQIHGALCGCGNLGCAESYFSARGLLNRYEEKSQKPLKAVKELFQLVRSQDPQAIETLHEGLEALIEVSRNIVNLLNVDTIAYVGGLTKSWDLFGNKLESGIRAKVLPVLSDRLKIYSGSNHAVAGAASLVFNKNSLH
jgi:glucokinase